MNNNDFWVIGVLHHKRLHPGLPQRLEKRDLGGCGDAPQAFRQEQGDTWIRWNTVEPGGYGGRGAGINARTAELPR